MNKEILSRLNEIVDPITGKRFGETEAVKHIGVSDDKVVTLVIEIGLKTDEIVTDLTRKVAKVIKLDMGYKGVKVSFEQVKFKDEKNIKFIGIASGKGGVGKSTVTANIAYALTQIGKKVAIIDADIYGSSIPKIFDITEESVMQDEDGKIIPIEKFGIEVIASEYFAERGKPIMWRGPMLSKLLTHFHDDVKWHDEIEYILVDLPPGTGDVTIDIQKLIPQMEIIIVTTPHPNASHVAIKAGYAARTLKQEVIGVVENMSYYYNRANGMQEFLFGQGGGMQVAELLDVPMLAQIPIGMPQTGHHSLFTLQETTGIIFLDIAKQIIKRVG